MALSQNQKTVPNSEIGNKQRKEGNSTGAANGSAALPRASERRYARSEWSSFARPSVRLGGTRTEPHGGEDDPKL